MAAATITTPPEIAARPESSHECRNTARPGTGPAARRWPTEHRRAATDSRAAPDATAVRPAMATQSAEQRQAEIRDLNEARGSGRAHG
jgi:hypothetical protein